MKRNPVIPFAIIAVVGILVMIVVSTAGNNQREAIQNAEDGGEQQQETTTDASPEEMFQNQCASCHGGDLSGGMGPNLQEVGSKYSAEEIQGIIENGKGQMPAGLYSGEQAAKVAKWLAEKK